MFDLESANPPQTPLVPPQYGLFQQCLPLSLFVLSFQRVAVHFVAGHAPPMVQCNGGYVGECSLCALGFPALIRYLTLAYDHDSDRLWAALLPEEIRESIIELSEGLPDYRWHFTILWSGASYFVEKNESYGAMEFTLAKEERERVMELLDAGHIDLEGAIPKLSNGSMLRLPMVVSAAGCFGFDQITLGSVDRTEDSSIHW